MFGRSVGDKTLQCDCDIHPWEILVNEDRWSGKIRLIGFVDIFFLISYSENSRFNNGIVVYKDNEHIESILKGAKMELKDTRIESKNNSLQPASSESTQSKTTEEKIKYTTFSRDTVDYKVTSIGHTIGLQTKYPKSELKIYTVQLRKPEDPVLKQNYKRALKVHDTLDMIQDAMKLGLVSYAEILGNGMGHIYRGSSTLDIGKGFVGGLGGSQPAWIGLSGGKS